MTAPLPLDEEARLATLGALDILDTLPEADYDDLVRVAGALLDVPIALVSMVDRERQWFKAKAGVDVCETSRDLAFCAHAILESEPLVVIDATLDARFTDNSLVTGPLGIRFYAGAPIVVDGHALGTVCCLDTVPRQPSSRQIEALAAVARQAGALLRARAEAQRFAQGERRFAAFFDNAPATVFLKDEAGRMRYVNRRFETLFDRPAAEVIGRTDHEWLPKAFAEACAIDDEATRGVGVRQIEERVPIAEDRYQIWQTHKFAIDMEEGQWVGGIAIDVTALREAEDTVRLQNDELLFREQELTLALQETETSRMAARLAAMRFEQLFAGLPVACFTYSIEGTIHEWNAAAESLWGIQAEDALLASVHRTVVGPENHAGQEEVDARVFAGEIVSGVERRETMRDGETRWLLTSTFPLRSPSGTIVGAVSANVDVTARKLAEEELQASEARFRTVVDSLHEGVVVQDAAGGVSLWNRSAERIIGIKGEEFDLRSARDPRSYAFREDGTEIPIEARPAALAIQDGLPHEAIIGTKTTSGETRWHSLVAVPLPSQDGSAAQSAVVSFLDVTDRKRMEKALRESEARFRTVVQSLAEGLVVHDETQHVVYCNRSAERILGISGDALRGQTQLPEEFRIVNEDGSESMPDDRPVAHALRTGESQMPRTLGVHRSDGEFRWISVGAVPVESGVEGRTREAVASFLDITQRIEHERQIREYSAGLEAANARLENLATTDGLTGLKNHRFFQDWLRRRIDQSVGSKMPLSIALLDVDRFKAYNDDFGHQAGDAVLRGVAIALESSVRGGDLVARYGGEEFVIVMPGAAQEEAVAVADRVRQAISKLPFPDRAVTASFGVSSWEPDISDAPAMIRAADEALYRSKDEGRNRVTHYRRLMPALHAASRRRLPE